MIDIRSSRDFRISFSCSICARISASSASSFSISRPVSRASRMFRIASDCRSLRSKRSRSCWPACSESGAPRMILITSSMLSTAILSPSRMCSRSRAPWRGRTRSAGRPPCADGRRSAAASPAADMTSRHATDQSEHDHPEGGLHLGVLEQLVEHDLWNRIALELDHDPHAVAIGLVAQVGDVGRPFLSRTSCAICSMRRDLFTMNGISVTTIRCDPGRSPALRFRRPPASRLLPRPFSVGLADLVGTRTI